MADPFIPYQEMGSQNNGKGKGPPIVPEPSSYGFGIMILAILIAVGITKWKKTRSLTSKNN